MASPVTTDDEAIEIIHRLLEWAEYTGGWEAPIWDRAKQFVNALDKGQKPC